VVHPSSALSAIATELGDVWVARGTIFLSTAGLALDARDLFFGRPPRWAHTTRSTIGSARVCWPRARNQLVLVFGWFSVVFFLYVWVKVSGPDFSGTCIAFMNLARRLADQ
jgi:hypothetical protein